ncbi:MAG: SDR family NAD(P)-dependent oxidoreductase [Desulfobacteraceae bacterium]|jgi:short-subunit dehydrogenase
MKQVALITGALSGIGAELANVFAEKGYDLVLVARNTERLEALASKLESLHHIQAKHITKDMSEPRSAEQVYHELQKESIFVDFLVSNAGFVSIQRN